MMLRNLDHFLATLVVDKSKNLTRIKILISNKFDIDDHPILSTPLTNKAYFDILPIQMFSSTNYEFSVFG